MKKLQTILLATSLLCVLVFADSCRKDLSFDNSVVVSFESDSLHFDTAFTSTIAPTRRILLFNSSSKSVNINRLYLEQGSASYFRIGVDAQTGYEVNDLVILPNDSAYIFVSASIDPNNDSLPFLVSDKLIAETDGGRSSCVIDAYGQNAIFYRDVTIGTTTWTADLPIVLLGNVIVEEGATLTIEAGTQIYCQSKKGIGVYGTLIANGTKEDSILFRGNRLDRGYFADVDHAGEWAGIYLAGSSHNNYMEHVYIKNASTGIVVDSPASQGHFKLKMRKSTIFNSLGQGIFSRASAIDLQNCRFISNNVNVAVVLGGELYMNHCTLGGYSVPYNNHSTANKSVSLVLFNYFIENNILYPGGLKAKIYNSAICGSLSQEALIDSVSSAGFELEIRNSLLQTDISQGVLQNMATVYSNVILNVDPGFTDPSERDYTYNSTSPLYRAVSTFSLPQDIHDKTRAVPTDIGCEEIF